MKKTSVLFLTVLTVGLAAQIAFAHSDLNDFVGTWEYTVMVPSQSEITGNLVIANEDNKPSAKFITDSGDAVEVDDVTFENEQLTISFEYNYESYTMKLTQNETNKLSGVVVTPQGQELDITANRESDS
jgi:hypothetical protein